MIAEPEYNPEFVRKERDFEAAEQWPYVTKTRRIADLASFAGVSLSVIGKSGMSFQRGGELSRAEFERIGAAMEA